ncbi:MAG: histidinol dehydrogenase [Candidatus Aureabacteria bacterium]|nr:histidinol dehydrogenase [Candidatus Auribacterota bacterium]
MNAVEKIVSEIIEKVRRQGDRALVSLSMKYDHVRLPRGGIRVPRSEIASAVQCAGIDFARLIRTVARNIAAYHRAQLPRDRAFKNMHGARVGWRYVPVERVGVYLPAGKAPLVSTALMTIVPAKVAGVCDITVASPPQRDGRINPFVLAACHLLGADRIVRVGGAQAIAAMALGTKSIPRVDLIVGPGNVYVTEAKRQLYGRVGIDMTAGPSEVAIVADESAPPGLVAADLLSQAEHDRLSVAILFTTSARLIRRVKEEITKQSRQSNESVSGVRYVKCKNIGDAAESINRMAPEHLQIMTVDPGAFAARVRNAGAIFAGSFSATAFGDYVAGPSHVLPTGGTARFFSALSVETFLKRISCIRYNRNSAAKAIPLAEKLAQIEGLQAHARALRLRVER